MAETKVKQNQLDMTQIADASLSNLSDSAPVGLTNALTPLSKTVGYTVMGSPTITDGVANGFSTSNSIQLTSSVTMENDSNIEIFVRFKTPTSLENGFNPIWYGNGQISWCGFSIYNNSLFNMRIAYANSTAYHVEMSSYTYQANTWYKAKLVGNNGMWNGYVYADDGTTVLAQGTQDYISTVFSEAQTIKLDCRNSTDTASGSIDLNNTYIKVDGEYWFVGRWDEINPWKKSVASDTFVKLTIGEQYAAYVAPADGEFYALGKGPTNGYMMLYKDASMTADVNQTLSDKLEMTNSNAGGTFSVRLRVKAGDVVHFGYSASFSETGFTNMGLWFRYANANEAQ